MAPDEDRLERIERKLDGVEQAIVSLARMEERMVSLFRRMDKYDQAQAQADARVCHKIEKCDATHSEIVKRLTVLERSAGINGQTLRFAERVFWIVATATVALVVTKLGGGI